MKKSQDNFKIAKSVENETWLRELQDIVACSFDGILVTDGEGNGLLANQAYERNTGMKLNEVVGHNMQELMNSVRIKDSIALLAIEQKQAVSMSHITKHNRNIIVTGTPIFDQNNQIKLVVVNTKDISEIYRLKEALNQAREMERLYYKQVENRNSINDGAVVINSKMKELYGLARRICNFNTTVLITGDSGVGKELLARYIHEQSDLRRDKAFVAVNCGAIPERLLESELFGYVEDTIIGDVIEEKKGLFETSDGGTLFLDEIGEISQKLQVKLLRVLEKMSVLRLGASKEVSLNLRIIAATNQDLEKQVKEGDFCEDLYYRLNVVSLNIPPLKDRKDEIAPLALRFLKLLNWQYSLNKKFTYEVLEELKLYSWPGNIRQLKNVIEHMAVVSDDEYLHLKDIPWIKTQPQVSNGPGEEKSFQTMVEEYEKSILLQAKKEYSSTRKIGKALQLDQSTVVRKMQKYNIDGKVKGK